MCGKRSFREHNDNVQLSAKRAALAEAHKRPTDREYVYRCTEGELEQNGIKIKWHS